MRCRTWAILLAAAFAWYAAAIPALFDVAGGRAFVLPGPEYERQLHGYLSRHDVLIHDGAELGPSIRTLDERLRSLEQEMMRANPNCRRSWIPRWYAPYADYHHAIQRRSFLHLLYPFL